MAGLFGFFDYNKVGKGVSINEPPKKPIVQFFTILGRKFWKIVQINLMYFVFSLPVLIVSIVAAQLIMNLMLPGISIETLAQFFKETGVTLAEGTSFEEFAASQLIIIYILLGFMLTGLSLIITGPVHAGFTYVMRNYSRQEHAFIWADAKEHAIKNIKQSIISSLISLGVTLIAAFSFSYYMNNDVLNLGLFETVILTLIFVAFLIWSIMQMYLYPMMVTFKLTLKQLYKNCLILSIMRLPINILLLFFSVSIFLLIPYGFIMFGSSLTVLIALIWYAFIAFGLNLLMTNFFVYRGLDKYLMQRIESKGSPSDSLE